MHCCLRDASVHYNGRWSIGNRPPAASGNREANVQTPAPTNPKPAPSPVPAATLPAALPRILLADDNPQRVELLEAYLAAADWERRTAPDGDQTLKQVAD